MWVNCNLSCLEVREKAHRAYSSVYLKFEIMQTKLVCQRTSVWLPVAGVSSWWHWVEAERDRECGDSHFICTDLKFMIVSAVIVTSFVQISNSCTLSRVYINEHVKNIYVIYRLQLHLRNL